MEIKIRLETLFWIPVQHDDILTVGICNILTTLYYNRKNTDTEIPVRISPALADSHILAYK